MNAPGAGQPLQEDAALAAQRAGLRLIAEGNAHLGAARPEAALDLFRSAHHAWPSADACYSVAVAHEHLGAPQAAIDAYRAALALDPRRLEPRVNLGILLRETAPDDALHHHLVAHALDPHEPRASFNLGETLWRLGYRLEAELLLRRCLASRPSFAPAQAALAAHAAGPSAPATDPGRLGYALALLFSSDETEAWCALAGTYEAAGQHEKRWDALLLATDLAPDRADYLAAFEAASRTLGRTDFAVAALQRLARLLPGNATVFNNLGSFALERKRYGEAIDNFEVALRLAPGDVRALRNLAFAHSQTGDSAAALRRYGDALALDPDNGEVLQHVICAAQQVCDWRDFDARCAALRDLMTRGRMEGIGPFPLVAIPGIDGALQRACASAFVAGRLGGGKPMRSTGQRRAGPPRVGFVCGEFREHATAFLLAEIVEQHERAQVETFAFSTAPAPGSAMRDRLRAGFDHFFDIDQLTDEQAADLVRSLDIDILIDLNVFTGTMRLGLFAQRPCAIQVSYLGFPGTSGAPFIDYLIADDVVIPLALEPLYSERVLRLPHCYQPNDRRRPLPPAPSRAEAGLPETGFVFASFNSVYKITPHVFDIWCALLKDVPGSVLWILSSDAAACANLRREASARGIAGERIIFAPRLGLADHLARFCLADLFLDTFPCNAHTTASDALWCAVPVVTRMGETFASRVAASILHAAGLPELVTRDAAAYHALALRLAREPLQLARLKAHLEDVRMTCPLFDSATYARDLEELYQRLIGFGAGHQEREPRAS